MKTVLMLDHASTILRLLQEVREMAPLKVLVISVTMSTDHFSSPAPLNVSASLNVLCISVTADTSQPPKFTFIESALLKVFLREVTIPVVH